MGQIAGASTGIFLASNKVPFIGWSTNAAFEAEPKWGLGINGNQGNPDVQGLAGMTQILTATGNTSTPGRVKMAFIGENAPGVIAANKALAGAAKYSNIKVVLQTAPIPLTGTITYAPYAQSLISSGANVVYEVAGAADAVGLAAALKSAGYKGLIVNGTTYFPGGLASQPSEAAALNGVYLENEFPADENQSAATNQEMKDLVSTGQKPYLTSGVSVGYWSAIILEEMLKATLKAVGNDPTKVTGVTLQKTVQGGFSYTDPLAGGIGDEYFPAANTIPTGCGTLLKTTGTTYKQVVPFQCVGAVNVLVNKAVNQKTGKVIP
jgi:ABC-type branched-subunit amino acid transport system substrate-binding protein